MEYFKSYGNLHEVNSQPRQIFLGSEVNREAYLDTISNSAGLRVNEKSYLWSKHNCDSLLTFDPAMLLLVQNALLY